MLPSNTLRGILDNMPYLYQKALVLTRNAEDAKDLLQDVMVKVLELSVETPPCVNMRPWLSSIMRNHWLDAIDSRQAQRTLQQRFLMTCGESDASLLDTTVTKHQLARAMSQLPPSCMQTLEVLVHECRSYRRTANVLKLPVGTVARRVRKSRRVIENFLKESGLRMLI